MTWRTARRGWCLVVAAALALVAWSLVSALGARADLQQARQGLQRLQASGTDLDQVSRALGPARADASTAAARRGSRRRLCHGLVFGLIAGPRRLAPLHPEKGVGGRRAPARAEKIGVKLRLPLAAA